MNVVLIRVSMLEGRTSLSNLQEFCKGKRVLLVGNSVTLMNAKHADYIDSFDVVVRFGRALIATRSERKAIGSKIDVWVTGSYRAYLAEEPVVLNRLKDSYILFCRSRLKHGTKNSILSPIEEHSITMHSDDEILTVQDGLGIIDGDISGARISNGTWTIKFFVEKITTYESLTLFGFDFFQHKAGTKTGIDYPASWHMPGLAKTPLIHQSAQELEWVEEYERKGKLEWVKIPTDSKYISNTKYGRF